MGSREGSRGTLGMCSAPREKRWEEEKEEEVEEGGCGMKRKRDGSLTGWEFGQLWDVLFLCSLPTQTIPPTCSSLTFPALALTAYFEFNHVPILGSTNPKKHSRIHNHIKSLEKPNPGEQEDGEPLPGSHPSSSISISTACPGSFIPGQS